MMKVQLFTVRLTQLSFPAPFLMLGRKPASYSCHTIASRSSFFVDQVYNLRLGLLIIILAIVACLLYQNLQHLVYVLDDDVVGLRARLVWNAEV